MVRRRKHPERVRTAALVLMGVVVAMLGIGAGLTYAVVLAVKDTEVLDEETEDVRCRWCGKSEGVVPLLETSPETEPEASPESSSESSPQNSLDGA